MRTHAAGDTSPCCAVGCVASGPTTFTAPTRSPAVLKTLPPPGIGERAGLVEAIGRGPCCASDRNPNRGPAYPDEPAQLLMNHCSRPAREVGEQVKPGNRSFCRAPAQARSAATWRRGGRVTGGHSVCVGVALRSRENFHRCVTRARAQVIRVRFGWRSRTRWQWRRRGGRCVGQATAGAGRTR